MPTVDRNVADLLDELKMLVKFRQERQLSTLDSVLAKKLYRFEKGCARSFTSEDVLCLFHEDFTESALWGQVDDLLVGNLSTILTTCSASRGKMQCEISASGASRRHDMDRFFPDFLAAAISPVLQSEMDGQDNTKGQQSLHAVLECMIALPRSVYGGHDLNNDLAIKKDARGFINTIDILRADWKNSGLQWVEGMAWVEGDIHHGLGTLCRKWRDALTPDHIKERLAISSTQARCQHNEPEMTHLDLPLILVEYKGLAMNHVQSQNQRRLHCTSAARFMEAIGIIEFPIFSVLSDGPLAVLATTWVKDGMVSFDVSNMLGAWHYASVIARIVVFWGTALANRFEQVKDKFVEGVNKDDPRLRWTQTHQALHHALRDAPVDIAPDNEP
ncbi:hypothetical protein IEO21_09521 [Rhodonia placenta]|uniref:Uncharacterized protein n=1 Tax=Rhodonia placenta TaxID=104341 RepID=A0A8H7TYE1_9APHY|nr:hypothetical protein IEO21_09521 [Postia placenta]